MLKLQKIRMIKVFKTMLLIYELNPLVCDNIMYFEPEEECSLYTHRVNQHPTNI